MEFGPESLAMIQNAAFAVIALLVVMTFYTLFGPMIEGDKLKKRMNSVSTAREDMRAQRMKDLNGNGGSNLGIGAKDPMSKFVSNLSLDKVLEASDLRDKLAQAGFRGQRPVYVFYMFRLCLPVGLGLFGLLRIGTPVDVVKGGRAAHQQQLIDRVVVDDALAHIESA